MSVAQSGSLSCPLQLLVLGSVGGSAMPISLPSLISCLRASEGSNAAGIAKPSFLKQRVKYAEKHINESCAATLVHFLIFYLHCPTALEKIVGVVDISRKKLTCSCCKGSQHYTKCSAWPRFTNIKPHIHSAI
ncbi:hypothetical protein MKW92_043430 [Papaver armeniacum]|nr:hypothetical protein MKW92_043430 [Papaver armeniacum]